MPSAKPSRLISCTSGPNSASRYGEYPLLFSRPHEPPWRACSTRYLGIACSICWNVLAWHHLTEHTPCLLFPVREQCWCSDSLAETVKFDHDMCTKPCLNTPSEICGGFESTMGVVVPQRRSLDVMRHASVWLICWSVFRRSFFSCDCLLCCWSTHHPDSWVLLCKCDRSVLRSSYCRKCLFMTISTPDRAPFGYISPLSLYRWQVEMMP